MLGYIFMYSTNIVLSLYKYTLSKSWFKQSVNLKIQILILNIWSTAQPNSFACPYF